MCELVRCRTKVRGWPTANINSIINYTIRSHSTMDTLHIKQSSGKYICCPVFCMTGPLVTHTDTSLTHSQMGIWQHGMGRSPPLHKCFVVADSEQQCNKTPTSLLNELLLRPLGQTVKKTQVLLMMAANNTLINNFQ